MPEIDPEWLFSGVSGSQGPQGCSCWSKMVPGHWYTVPHYATALPGSIVDFKIPNLAKIWPEMDKKCSFWVVFWGFLSPRGPRGVQVGILVLDGQILDIKQVDSQKWFTQNQRDL